MNTATILQEVEEELLRARAKYPDFHSSHEGHSLIDEERQELWDLVKADHSTKPSDVRFIEKHGGTQTYRGAMRAECIQIAAMAIRFAEDLCDQ